MSVRRPRVLEVPVVAAGLRLDQFLSKWFHDHSRSAISRGMKAGLVTDPTGKQLRGSLTMRGGEVLWLYLPGIAPEGEPPPLPPLLYEDERMLVVDKPAGMLTHPAGNDFTWAVVSLAREVWPDADLVHRIDKDTSGVLVLSKDADANRFLKRAFHDGEATKEYVAITRGRPRWDTQSLTGPIGEAGGAIRIQMAVRSDGQAARTDVTVLERHATADYARVHCRLYTGRTHQIRVHLAHAGFSLLGDRMYGVPEAVFLHAWDIGVDDSVIERAGAPRQALHAAKVVLPHPEGGWRTVESPEPPDMRRWWESPEVLPFDRDASAVTEPVAVVPDKE